MGNPMKICYVITEKNGKSFFNRVGVAFTNRDGSLNVKLDAIPVNGELHIRDYVPRDEEKSPSKREDVEVVGDGVKQGSFWDDD
jgi:hypothetical protein